MAHQNGVCACVCACCNPKHRHNFRHSSKPIIFVYCKCVRVQCVCVCVSSVCMCYRNSYLTASYQPYYDPISAQCGTLKMPALNCFPPLIKLCRVFPSFASCGCGGSLSAGRAKTKEILAISVAEKMSKSG